MRLGHSKIVHEDNGCLQWFAFASGASHFSILLCPTSGGSTLDGPCTFSVDVFPSPSITGLDVSILAYPIFLLDEGQSGSVAGGHKKNLFSIRGESSNSFNQYVAHVENKLVIQENTEPTRPR